MALRQERSRCLVPAAEPQQLHEEVDNEEEFQDAEEEAEMDMETAFQDSKLAINKFFKNEITEAISIMTAWSRTSIYHSLGAAMFEFIPAILCFDGGRIAVAQTSLKKCIALCLHHRHNRTIKESIGTIINRPNYAAYTDLEAHAELVYAEALLLQAALTILEGEDLTGLIRGTFKVKTCYNSYKECMKILDNKDWNTEESRVHFQSGVRLGIAAFNVMVSLLPPRVITLLEFVGFSGNKDAGLAELLAGSRAPGMRSVLCSLFLLGYNLIICHFIGIPANMPVCQEIFDRELQVYPEGIWFLALKARYQLMEGRLHNAIQTYNQALNCDRVWPQFHHLCYWELMWINAFLMQWQQAAYFADKLIRDSNWSKTIYIYCKGAWLLMLDDMTREQKAEVETLFRNAAKHRRRIAGKSLPMEKFVLKRCTRFKAQGNNLLLPGLELMVLWNFLPILMKAEQGHSLLKIVEKATDGLEKGGPLWTGRYTTDNVALLRFLRGSIYAAMNLPSLALDSLSTVLRIKNDIYEDTFLLPYSMLELAMCHFSLGEAQRAINILQDTRKKHTGYSLESWLHFRLHAKIAAVKAALDGGQRPATSS